ncbi:MAG: Na+/H+ antiporter subunit E [Gemmatimonadota bacterium]
MRSSLSLGLSMAAAWLLWSGYYTPLLLSCGAASCLLVVWLARRMSIADPEGHPIHLLGRGLVYAPWLIWSVVRSNVDVAFRILSPSLPISPRILRVRASQKTDLGRAVYANSITLAPGTVAVDLEGDVVTVHALTAESAAELRSGSMDRKVTAMEGEA